MIKCTDTNNFKIVNAQQEKDIYNFKHTNEKLYKINASIWFDNMCRT